jgi:hypothetical protein
MTELFNHRSSVPGKIPSGLFNASFGLDGGSWAQDASSTKCLAVDGYFISLLDLRLDCQPLAIADHVVADVPDSWDPPAIARYVTLHDEQLVDRQKPTTNMMMVRPRPSGECKIVNHTLPCAHVV